MKNLATTLTAQADDELRRKRYAEARLLYRETEESYRRCCGANQDDPNYMNLQKRRMAVEKRLEVDSSHSTPLQR